MHTDRWTEMARVHTDTLGWVLSFQSIIQFYRHQSIRDLTVFD